MAVVVIQLSTTLFCDDGQAADNTPGACGSGGDDSGPAADGEASSASLRGGDVAGDEEAAADAGDGGLEAPDGGGRRGNLKSGESP